MHAKPSFSAMAPQPVPTQPTSEAPEPPIEASPWWPLVLTLGEIALRIERRRSEEQASSNDDELDIA
jgi:hypothetical protein